MVLQSYTSMFQTWSNGDETETQEAMQTKSNAKLRFILEAQKLSMTLRPKARALQVSGTTGLFYKWTLN